MHQMVCFLTCCASMESSASVCAEGESFEQESGGQISSAEGRLRQGWHCCRQEKDHDALRQCHQK